MRDRNLIVYEDAFNTHTGPLFVSFDFIRIRKNQKLGENDLVFLTQDAPGILSWAFECDREIWYNLTRKCLRADPTKDLVGGTVTSIVTFKHQPSLVTYYKVVPLKLLEEARDKRLHDLKQNAEKKLPAQSDLERALMNIECMQSCFPSPPDIHFYLSVLSQVPYTVYNVNFRIICPKTITSINLNQPKKELQDVISTYSTLKDTCTEKAMFGFFTGKEPPDIMKEACKRMNQNELGLTFFVEQNLY